MKKIIILCLLFYSCSKKDNTVSLPGYISFSNGAIEVKYSGNHIPNSIEGIYYSYIPDNYYYKYQWLLGGGNSTTDYFVISFASDNLNLTDSTLSKTVAMGYAVNGKFYASSSSSPCLLHISNLQLFNVPLGQP